MLAALPVAAVAFCAIGAMTPENLRSQRFPNRRTLLAVTVTLAALVVVSAVEHRWDVARSGLVGGATMAVLSFLLALAFPAGVGFGVVKLSPVPGLAAGALGVRPWLVCLGAIVVGAALHAGIMWTRHPRSAPLAPAFLLGIAAATTVAML